MRVVITGASGNVGSALVERLAAEERVDSVVGICRRPHEWRPPKTTWQFLDVADDDLVPVFDGADAVVHLAWLFQPTRDPQTTWHANVTGTDRVLRAVDRAGVPAVVVASSVGAYSPRVDRELVDESWPTHGWPANAYSREKAFVERLLDVHELASPGRRVVRMRPAFTFQHRASVQQRRLFVGPLLPVRLMKPGRLPVVPDPGGLHFQALHADDAATAYAGAVLQPVEGAFNLAGEPVLDVPAVAQLLRARTATVPTGLARTALAAAFHARLAPASPDLFELLVHAPLMSTARAHEVLGWRPAHPAPQAVAEFLEGLLDSDGWPTPPLAPQTSGRFRRHEAATGVGATP
jgi:nucleoside-diphosphate-sugar epimerase